MLRDGAPGLRAEACWDGTTVTVAIAGELDISTAPSLARTLAGIAGDRPEQVILDLSALVFTDVAGARTLDRAYTSLHAQCPVTLRHPCPSARKVFRLTGLLDS